MFINFIKSLYSQNIKTLILNYIPLKEEVLYVHCKLAVKDPFLLLLLVFLSFGRIGKQYFYLFVLLVLERNYQLTIIIRQGILFLLIQIAN